MALITRPIVSVELTVCVITRRKSHRKMSNMNKNQCQITQAGKRIKQVSDKTGFTVYINQVVFN